MNVVIRQTNCLDFEDVIRRSAVANMPNAIDSLLSFIHQSAYTFVGEVDGRVACVWGFIQPTMLSNKAYLWLLITDLVDQHKFIFIRQSQRFMEKMLKTYDCILGHANPKDQRAIRWLRMLGAEFEEPFGLTLPFRIKAK